jgi:phosphoglycolate phosphatase-like HAD superfamily hydrolase
MLKQVVLFDFDGVLVDSVPVKEEAFGALYREYGVDIVTSVKAYHREHGGLSRFDKFQYYHQALLGGISPLSTFELESLSRRFSECVVQMVIDADEIRHAAEVLHTLHGQVPMHLLSATPEEELAHIVKARGMSDYFCSVHGSPQKKSAHIVSLIKCHGYDRQSMVLIGDALHDYEASCEANIAFIGFVPSSEENRFPDDVVVIHDLKVLLECILH